MIVRSKRDYSLVGTGYCIDSTKVYRADVATNQQDYKEKGLVFVDGMILGKDEYDIVPSRMISANVEMVIEVPEEMDEDEVQSITLDIPVDDIIVYTDDGISYSAHVRSYTTQETYDTTNDHDKTLQG